MKVMIVAFTKGRRCLLSERAHIHICSQSNCFSRLKMKLTIGHCYSTLWQDDSFTDEQAEAYRLPLSCSFRAGEPGSAYCKTSTPHNLRRCCLQADYQWVQAIYCTKQTVLEYSLPVISHPFGLQSGSNGAMKNTTFDYHHFEIGQRAGCYTMYIQHSWKWTPLSESLIPIEVTSCTCTVMNISIAEFLVQDDNKHEDKYKSKHSEELHRVPHTRPGWLLIQQYE